MNMVVFFLYGTFSPVTCNTMEHYISFEPEDTCYLKWFVNPLKSLRFSYLNQTVRLHINLYFFLIQTPPQLRPLPIIVFLEDHMFQ